MSWVTRGLLVAIVVAWAYLYVQHYWVSATWGDSFLYRWLRGGGGE